jgi:16S rRNA (uracil1498-N3)-methyltransferase
MHYFYSTHIDSDRIILSKEEAHHALRVIRLKEGDKVGVFDGNGRIYTCIISMLNKQGCELAILEVDNTEINPSKLSVYIAPTKNIDRFEWFLEKATEIGVKEITPIISFHSERKKIRFDRLEKVLISAMKQSMNPFLPKLNPMITFNEVLNLYPDSDRFISHCENRNRKKLFDQLNFSKPTAIMIGPEGDFSSAEIDKAEELGWIGVSMGKQRLRTETAGVLAVHMYMLKE